MFERGRWLTRQTILVASVLIGVLHARGQVFPLEFRQNLAPFNLASTNGVPLSNVRNNPPGSNGQLHDAGVPTLRQFEGHLSYGAVVRPHSPHLRSDSASFAANAENTGLPVERRATGVTLVLARATVGAPFLSRQVSFLFGDVIPVPDTDVSGNLLPANVIKTEYWAAEPHWDNRDANFYHVDAPYYWSPHRRAAFAVQSGPVAVVWKKAVPDRTKPTDYDANPGAYFVESGNYYRLYTNRVVVSGSATKPPKRMFWTEGVFKDGKPVAVEKQRIGGVKIVYNTNVPEIVPDEYFAPGQIRISSDPNQQPIKRDKTFWYDADQGLIFAYNREGRVFMEILGDLREDKRTRQHLGFEIVDIFQQPTPRDLNVDLGERIRIPAVATGELDDTTLFPEPVPQGLGLPFHYTHNPDGSTRPGIYAVRETRNQNDFLVHWLEEGIGGLKWPYVLARYKAAWPTDPAKYSHYVRPLVATEEEAQETAVPLPTDNTPFIQFQDEFDTLRANITQDIKFYTFLSTSYPAHRTLIRYMVGDLVAFERVFSWLDTTLKTATYAESIATGADYAKDWLTAWNPGSSRFQFPDEMLAPRVSSETVEVGQRLRPPTGELGASGDYWAGHIRPGHGTHFHPGAYVDPLTAGFVEANKGAIIPVNSVPGTNTMEVWWFRERAIAGVSQFKPVFWPSIIGRYTIVWPTAPREIVLASNDGTGPLSSFESRGFIYYQNDRNELGYNPNEEHALVSGGQAYALRDDLNITTTGHSSGQPYSSEPFVLLEYVAGDGRPAISTFKVLREKPSSGQTFDYVVEAGKVLQPPMPLAIMDKPMTQRTAGGAAPLSLNTEVSSWIIESNPASTDHGVEITTEERHSVRELSNVVLQNLGTSPLVTYNGFVYSSDPTGRKLNVVLSPSPAVALRYSSGQQPAFPNQALFETDSEFIANPGATALLFTDGNPAPSPAIVLEVTSRPGGGKFVRVGVPFAVSNQQRAASHLVLGPVASHAASAYANWRLGYQPLPPALADNNLGTFYASATLQDRKGTLWVYRGPHTNGLVETFQMQYYYKTLPGFYFPTLAPSQQPPVGTITPYLREGNPTAGFAGNAAYGNANNDAEADGNAYAIAYHPVWPANTPTLQMAETLTLPKRGLPSVRGQTSLEVVYQQSMMQGVTNRSAVLHDPTREKSFPLGEADNGTTLDKLPDSVRTQGYRGRTYFPNLPPHLSERFFFDPNRGAHGAMVFGGQFVDEPVGQDYILINVISPQDAAYLRGLCINDDPRKALWDSMVTNGLQTRMELFVEDLGKPGTYIPGGSEAVGPSDISEVKDDDVAVDSYALTATGPGTGYLTLIAGNGRAATPVADPVSVMIVRVNDTLYPGETKIVLPSNPLGEKITLQQVNELAGHPEHYRFEWKIAAPVDGLPPVVYENTRSLLLGDGTWNHLRFPAGQDLIVSPGSIAPDRLTQEVTTLVAPVSSIPFATVTTNNTRIEFTFAGNQAHRLIAGNEVVLRDPEGLEIRALVVPATTATRLVVELRQTPPNFPANFAVTELYEATNPALPQSIVFRTFTIPADANVTAVWLSADIADSLGTRVFLNGQPLAQINIDTNDTPTSSPTGDLTPLPKVYRLSPDVVTSIPVNPATQLRTATLSAQLVSGARPEAFQRFNLRLEAHESVDRTERGWLTLDPAKHPDGVRAVLGEGADVRSLADNYLIMRYQPTGTNHASFRDTNNDGTNDVWSTWTTPQLAEGWIKRVLAGINPFNQRVNDLFQNTVNTDASLLTQAGPRWEGDVALNIDTINNYGLIEIYETVLRRGRSLSIDSGINYGPANDALLLAAGYLNDLYQMLGNEAWADAANPTIGIGTKDKTYGDIATALFAFKGQLSSLLEEELALLRGRDDFLQPGVETPPVYNRLFWNYTRGIDSGEVIYALNYNIQEDTNQGVNGIVNADDARKLYPQGHGDAYGHYLTAAKGYYSLLMDTDFDWVPRTEAVTILGKPVQVDYLDERKFAAAAAAVARTGKQILDLTWRKDYVPGRANGWDHLQDTRTNTRRTIPVTRYWGVDHWASRVAQGTYINWVVGNAILPEVDTDPTHEGIQKIDRSTVPELKELPSVMTDLQTSLDNAEAGMSPLGVPENSIAFDIDPNQVVGGANKTHFEQILERAEAALRNALVAFDDAKDVTRLMRSEEDSLAELKAKVAEQELAYNHKLIELYGTPYTDDIGPGRTYAQGYTGPDYFHYMYVDVEEMTYPGLFDPADAIEAKVNIQNFQPDYMEQLYRNFDIIVPLTSSRYSNGVDYVTYNLTPHGFVNKPSFWTGRRQSPGRMQQAISNIIRVRNQTASAFADADWGKWDLDKSIQMFNNRSDLRKDRRAFGRGKLVAEQAVATAEHIWEIVDLARGMVKAEITNSVDTIKEAFPVNFIAGLAAGGDMTSAARAAVKQAGGRLLLAMDWLGLAQFLTTKTFRFASETANRFVDFDGIEPLEWEESQKDEIIEIGAKLSTLQGLIFPINTRLQELNDARRAYQSLVAEGDRIQEEREVFRQRSAAVVQGFRTRDAAFRIFRNEKLERYKTLFDLASRYAYLAATAYDYETGLLNTPEGRAFLNRIVSSRALGVVKNGEPQFAGSNTGDPGLSGVLAEMKADWLVLKGRLGFNNPDAYGTTVSLRSENFRILPGPDGANNWKDVLNAGRMDNLLDDPDVRRFCMQIDPKNGLPVPGIVVSFSTVIADGLNLFGQPLAPGDHNFSASSFATKIYSAGIALEGYKGMSSPSANSGTVGFAGGVSPSDPSVSFLDPTALAATPYVYLIPVGVDSMRSPPLGDESAVRTWSVDDVTVPLPFNIGASGFSTKKLWQSTESLTEEFFSVRKHQAFRPVSSPEYFPSIIHTSGGQLAASQFTNRRLIGRSVWNSRWKLVIPGHTLLNNPREGLDRFVNSVSDIKLHFVTYSYAGN